MGATREQFDRWVQDNPEVGKDVAKFLSALQASGLPAGQARGMALRVGSLIDDMADVQKTLKSEGLPPLESQQLQAKAAQIQDKYNAMMDRIAQWGGANGDVMQAVHHHMDSPASAAGLDVKTHAQHMHSTDPGGFTGRNLGNIEAREGNWPAAARAAQDSLKYEATPQAYGIVARAKQEMGEYPEAYQAAKAALEMNPYDPVAKAVAQFTRDRLGPAYSGSTLDKPGAASGQTAGAPEGHGAASPASAGGPVGFAAPLSGGASVDPARSLDLARKAERAYRLGDMRAAAEFAGYAIKNDPRNSAAWYLQARALLRTGDARKALAVAEDALRRWPKDARMLALQAEAFNRLGEYRRALASSAAAIEADDKLADAYVQKAWSLDGIGGRRAEALAAMERARELDPRYDELYKRMADLPDGGLADLLAGRQPAAQVANQTQLPSDRAPGKGLLLIGLLSIAGGFMIALGMLGMKHSNWLESLRSALSRISRRSPAVSPLAIPESASLSGNGAGGMIGGTYQVVRKLGVGGMGVVYEGRDRHLERRVAIKKMREEIRSDPRERERFLAEARTVAALHHPNIVEIYAIVEDGSDVYLVFEHVDGATLHDLIQRKRAMALGEALTLLQGTCAAMDYAHGKNVIHRDVKPSNIMVDGEGKVRVMDFGVARQAKDSLSRLSMTNTVVGTPPYMAPEQEQGMVRRESDVYALAVCLYEMVTGKLPFNGIGAGMLMCKMNKTYVPASRVARGLPAGFDEVMASALEPDPDRRFHSAGELLRALQSLQIGV